MNRRAAPRSIPWIDAAMSPRISVSRRGAIRGNQAHALQIAAATSSTNSKATGCRSHQQAKGDHKNCRWNVN
jgi:hypothetical protein